MENDLISLSALRTLAYHVTDNIIGVERCVVDWDDIEDAPAVDAVEVVRCKDCPNCEQMDYVFYCHHWSRNTVENGYCHEGT